MILATLLYSILSYVVKNCIYLILLVSIKVLMPPWNWKVAVSTYIPSDFCFGLIIRTYLVSWFPNCVVTWGWPTFQLRPGLYWISHGKTLDSPGHKDVHLCSPSLPVHNAPMWVKLFINWWDITFSYFYTVWVVAFWLEAISLLICMFWS